MTNKELKKLNDLVSRLLHDTVDVNSLDLKKEMHRKAFVQALEKRPSILKKVKDQYAEHFIGFALDRDYKYFIYLDKSQYTEGFAHKYICGRLNESADKAGKAAPVAQKTTLAAQKSLEGQTVLTYSVQDDEEMPYFDKELGALISLCSNFKVTLKITNALKLIEAIDLDVKELGAKKVKAVIADAVEAQYRSFLYTYMKEKDIGYYSLCTAIEDIENKLAELVGARLKKFAIEVISFRIKKIAVPQEILRRVADQDFKIRQQRADMQAEAELAKLSLEAYEAKLAIQDKYHDTERALTEYEKDRALQRYLIKAGRRKEDEIDRRIAVKTRGEEKDTVLEKARDIVPTIADKPNWLLRIFLAILAVSLIAVVAGFSGGGAGVGFILLGVATAGIGTFLAFFHDRLGRGKVEPDSTDDGGNGA